MKRFILALTLVLLALSFISTCTQAGSKVETITVWGKIKYIAPGNTPLPFGLPPSLKIRLYGEGYEKTLSVSDPVSGALKKGDFQFPNVPTEKDMHLEITCDNSLGESMRWFGTYSFHKPPPHRWNANRAGYVGDFTIDDSNPKNSQIKCKD